MHRRRVALGSLGRCRRPAWTGLDAMICSSHQRSEALRYTEEINAVENERYLSIILTKRSVSKITTWSVFNDGNLQGGFMQQETSTMLAALMISAAVLV